MDTLASLHRRKTDNCIEQIKLIIANTFMVSIYDLGLQLNVDA